jgi:hypothetical protein
MLLNRREFFKIVTALIASTVIPAFAYPRQPYVKVGDVVNYIGYHPGGFIGGQLVTQIFDWDGTGYPVIFEQRWKERPSPTYYDFDLSNFLVDIPKDFWHDEEHCKRYNNVHTYVRMQRFGESVEQAVEHLNFVTWRPVENYI